MTFRVRVSFVPSSSVAVTVSGPGCAGAAIGAALHAGRPIGAEEKQTCVSLRPPARCTSENRASPTWYVVRTALSPVKIAWTRRAGADDWAEATAGMRAAPATRAQAAARTAVRRMWGLLRVSEGLCPPNAPPRREVARDGRPAA